MLIMLQRIVVHVMYPRSANDIIVDFDRDRLLDTAQYRNDFFNSFVFSYQSVPTFVADGGLAFLFGLRK